MILLNEIQTKEKETMKNYFLKVYDFLTQLKYTFTYECAIEGVLVVNNKKKGIKNLVIGIADPILLMEQHMFNLNGASVEVFKELLKKNRDMIHGAFVLDEEGEKVIFRDTLQIENLDLNELEGSLESLSLLLSEYSERINNS